MIEEAARLLSAENRDAANVVNAKGRHLGVISMSDVIAAMVPPAAAAEASVEASAEASAEAAAGADPHG